MAITEDKIVQQTKSPFTADDAGSLAILTRLARGGEDQQGVHLSQVGRQGRPLHPLPPHHPVNLKQARKRERRERSEKNKDDLERRRNPNTTRGTNVLPLRTLPQAAVGPTVGHVERQGGHLSQEGKPVTR